MIVEVSSLMCAGVFNFFVQIEVNVCMYVCMYVLLDSGVHGYSGFHLSPWFSDI